MSKKINLGRVKLDLEDYAIQGNALVGIKESGKTYAATYLAEQLMTAGIPIVAFDPIDVWRYLRVPGTGAGYPVVIAGENGDLPLTVETAPRIVRAAMQAGVSLVLNLYSAHLSKAQWRRIVVDCVRTLFYENADYGPRHIFFEEAPEWAPQRVGPGHAEVYGEIEKLGRMGGNVYLGYTLIGQRSEEINKAVLEICDGLFLFRQKGRNSLAAVGKWLKSAGVTNEKEIAASIPLLGPGECWVWGRSDAKPKRTKVPEKQSRHPDRRMRQRGPALRQQVDVSAFVAQMQAVLDGKQPVIEWEPWEPVEVPAVNGQKLMELVAQEESEMEISNEQFERLLAKLDSIDSRLAYPGPSDSQAPTPSDFGVQTYQAVYDYMLDRLKREAPGLIVQLGHIQTEIHVSHQAKVVELDTSTLRGQVLYLVASGFFDHWASGTAATSEMAVRGWRTAAPNVYRVLDQLVTEGVLQKKERQGYLKVDGVKIVRKDK